MKLVPLALAAAMAAAAPLSGALAQPGPKKPHPHGMPPGQAKKIWAQGERLPAMYLAPRYYVVEPRRYQLPPTPYGYRYVLVEDRIYLVQDRTGVIRDVLEAILR